MLSMIVLVSCAAGMELGSRMTVAPVGPDNPRNTEAAIIELKDGSLLLGWTEFYAGNGADHGPARIRGKISTDRGKTWGEKYTLIENDGGCNVMEVNFLRLRNGDIALLYCQKNSEEKDCRVMIRTSSDEGKTFVGARQLSPEGKYTGLTNGRGLRLKSGRLLIEAWENETGYVLMSDDEGATWREGARIKPAAGGCWEPACVELKDGRVMMLMRTQIGGQFKSLSSDGGETWSEPVGPALKGTASPVSITRAPESGYLVAVWNNDTGNETSRNPLTAAISKDEGETWESVRNIEEGPGDRWAYPAITWIDGNALLTYFNYTGGLSLQLRAIPEKWFLGE